MRVLCIGGSEDIDSRMCGKHSPDWEPKENNIYTAVDTFTSRGGYECYCLAEDPRGNTNGWYVEYFVPLSDEGEDEAESVLIQEREINTVVI